MNKDDNSDQRRMVMRMRKQISRGVAVLLSMALLCTALPVPYVGMEALAQMKGNTIAADEVVRLEPENASKFNNGTFQGWGTSLCWWANRIGYSEALTEQATQAFFSLENGLGMNIARYNIGGGDDPAHDHIRRSDSKVPGIAKDVAISYDGNGAVATCTWSIDPTLDANQLNVLTHAKEKANANEFIVEAFSNSPPYFMTNSGCSSGAADSSRDNLRPDCYGYFADYLIQAASYLKNDLGMPLQSITAMNEPYTNYWGANGIKQEGCHFDQGNSQSTMITTLAAKMQAAGMGDVILSGTDETSIDTQITSYQALSPEAKAAISRIDTHAYNGSNRIGLRTLAQQEGKNLWMSEVDGFYMEGSNPGEMGAALGLGVEIAKDINGLMPSAWILWNAIDNHIDAANVFKDASDCDHSAMINTTNPYWGLAVADHDAQKIELTKKYYAYGQYSKYIRPGYTIISSADNMVAAYDKTGHKAVIVATNTSATDRVYGFDLSQFSTMGNSIQVIRTSGDMATGENWATVNDNILSADTANRNFYATLKSNSITTYIINDVVFAEKQLTEIPLTADMVTGSAPWNQSADVAANVVDQNIDTFFDGINNGYVTVNLGKAYSIDAISYMPRKGYIERCVKASLYGSADGTNWTKLYTIDNKPSATNYNYILAHEFEGMDNTYRYIKYAVPEGDNAAACNLAELKIYGTLNAGAYDDITIYPEYLERGSLAALPTTLNFSSSNGTTTTAQVTGWTVVSGDLNNLIGSTVTVSGTLDQNIAGFGNNVKLEIPVISTKLKYFVDCGADNGIYPASANYKLINSKVTLKNKDIPDQEYTEQSGWGHTVIGGSVHEAKDLGLNANGYYGAESKGKTITYQVTLDAGKYELYSGHYEWWNTGTRITNVNVSYNNSGEAVQTKLGSTKFNNNTKGSSGTVSGMFVVEQDNTKVTITFSKGTGGTEDGVVSYFAIDMIGSATIDTTALENLYNTYASVETNSVYTTSSWNALKTAIAGAKAVLEMGNRTKVQVTEATAALKTAVDGLKMIPVAELDSAAVASHGNILYIANCGNVADAAKIPSGYPKMGYYQSTTEQKNKVDAGKGTTWGYVENDTTITYGTHGTGLALKDTRRFTAGTVIYKAGETGIYYNFQVPANTEYEVTVGTYLPSNWPSRDLTVALEGVDQKDKINLYGDTTSEQTYKVTPADNELNVKVYNPNRSSKDNDACISYIIIKVPIPYTTDWLKETLKSYELTEAQKALYSQQSLTKYEEAYEHAKRVADGGTFDKTNNCWVYNGSASSTARVKSYYSKVVNRYAGLMKKRAPVTYNSFSGTDGDTWYDTNGVEIQAHGGQVIKFNDTWYWYGEDKTDGYRTVDGGVRVYSSKDLYNWKEEGIALRDVTDQYDFEEDYFAQLYGDYTEAQKEDVYWAINDTTSVIERPKVIYNEKTKKYVMWFHADGPVNDPNVVNNHNYYASCAGVAVSDTPVGPFKFIERSRLNYVEGVYTWEPGQGMARDMNLFVDDDGTGYIIYSSEGNGTLIISKLNDDYTKLAKTNAQGAKEGVDFLRDPTFIKQTREAPAIFKHDGKYFLVSSGCTGWGANQARYATADSVMGPWSNQGDPCHTDTSICRFTNSISFGTQPTCVFEVNKEKGQYIYMGDRWNNSDDPGGRDLYNPTYVWVPVEFGPSNEMILRPYADWNLNQVDKLNYFYTDVTSYPASISTLADMPAALKIKDGDGLHTVPVTWKAAEGALNAKGTLCQLETTFTDGIGKSQKITREVFVMSENLEYFVDCGSQSAGSATKDAPMYNLVKGLTVLQPFRSV